SNFVIQAGGFTFDFFAIPQITPVETFDPIQNEFDLADNSNVRGTLSMAQLGGDINSGTSQWFVNVVDNLSLDAIPHTVFGRVIGTGMEIVDEINALNTFELFEFFNENALTDVPLNGFVRSSIGLNGTVSIDIDSDVVTGTDTAFTSSIPGPGAHIRIDGKLFTVVSIESDTQLTISVAHPTGVTDVGASVEEPPDESHYVVFSDISKILEP
ncbi:MAG: peptidylprolyl isomerase, partial [Planctomycetes bacterium]|nr:peptidylprolyl isomerase [Planctomycetota bacterium]